MKASHSSNLDILGAPIGDYIHCAKLIASKWVEVLKLLSKLDNVAIIDPQVAFNLLCVWDSFCRLAHIYDDEIILSSLANVINSPQLDGTPLCCITGSSMHHIRGIVCGAEGASSPKGTRDEAVQVLFGCPFFSMKSVAMAPGV